MPQKQIKPPDHLRADTGRWWVEVHADFALEPHHTRLLTLAAETWDRLAEAREILAIDGICVRTSDGAIKSHPCVAIERDGRIAFARLLRELDLDTEAPAERGRPPALRSNRR